MLAEDKTLEMVMRFLHIRPNARVRALTVARGKSQARVLA
jgi:hypothetical protein